MYTEPQCAGSLWLWLAPSQYVDLIKEAIKATSKGGRPVSRQSIAKYLETKYGKVLGSRLRVALRLALKRLVTSKRLVQVKGSYKISAEEKAKKKAKKAKKPKAKKAKKPKKAKKAKKPKAAKKAKKPKTAKKAGKKAKAAKKPKAPKKAKKAAKVCLALHKNILAVAACCCCAGIGWGRGFA